MVRSGSRAPSTGRAPSVNKMRKNRDKPYKVQFESVMAKKKKLKLLEIHGSAKPLNGYTYLPVGFADLAEECKELSRQKDADVGVVSAGSRAAAMDPSKLSHHIYRVGYHFRTDIFDLACDKLGYSQRNGKLEKVASTVRPSRFEEKVSRYGSRFDLIDLTDGSEETSMKVKQHIRELFPKIPEADLQEIYERAWEQGARTVGNANDLSLSRQVQLATIARIRHMYTDYDHLLRVGTWKDARTAVEHECLAKLIEWRGEHDHDPEELEEILRETIVIDDESDDDEDQDNHTQIEDDSDMSFEIVQQTIAPRDLRVESNEPNHFSRSGGQAKRKQSKLLPAALHARWQSARSERYGIHPPQPKPDQTSHITVALDDQGKAPHTLRAGGVQYVRLAPDPEPSARHVEVHHPYVPSSQGPYGINSVHAAPRVQPMTHTEYNSRAWTSNRNATDDYPAISRADDYVGLANAAIPSIEKPYDSNLHRVAKTAYHGLPPHIDLVTPPKPRLQEGHAAVSDDPRSFEDRARQLTVQDHVQRDNGLPFRQARPRSQVPMSRSIHDKPVLARHHSGVEVVDLTRTSDYSQPIQEQQAYFEHGSAQQSRHAVSDRVYRQPVYGEAAYPQMRSHFTPAPRTSTRPVHGAPSTVQPVTAFGAPSPQHYFVGHRKPANGLLER